jgi:hypothetical protein
MPLFMDTHNEIEGLTGEAISEAHARDLEVGPKHGVTYITSWYDVTHGKIFCLVNAPSPEAASAVHREAHGLLADTITEVRQGV